MRWEGRRESSNIEDRRGSGGGNFGGGKGTGVLGISSFSRRYYGVDLSGLVGTPDFSGQSSQQLETQEEQQLASLSKVVLADTETVWGQYFRQMGKKLIASQPWFLLQWRNANRLRYRSIWQWVHSTARAIVKFTFDLSFYNEMKNKLGAAGDSALLM